MMMTMMTDDGRIWRTDYDVDDGLCVYEIPAKNKMFAQYMSTKRVFLLFYIELLQMRNKTICNIFSKQNEKN